MDPAADPISSGWQSIWLAVGGTLIYGLLDLFVLSRNAAFRRGATIFRVGFVITLAGVILGAYAWFVFAKGDAVRTNQILIGSYAVRLVGILALIVALVRMKQRSNE